MSSSLSVVWCIKKQKSVASKWNKTNKDPNFHLIAFICMRHMPRDWKGNIMWNSFFFAYAPDFIQIFLVYFPYFVSTSKLMVSCQCEHSYSRCSNKMTDFHVMSCKYHSAGGHLASVFFNFLSSVTQILQPFECRRLEWQWCHLT